MRIGVLNNLRAGRGGPLVSQILELLSAYPDVLHVETESVRVVPEALAEIDRHGVDLLVVNGGDGTLQLALTELLADPHRERVPAVAPLRGGRTNMTACDLGADRSPLRGLRNLLEAAEGDYLDRLAVSRPVLRVRSSRRAGDRYGMFFGAGLIQRAIRLVHRSLPAGRGQGQLGAGLVTASLVTKMLFRPTRGILTPDKCSVQVDGADLVDAELYLLIASSLDRLFLGLNPFWGRGPGGVRLTAVSHRAERLARAAPGILRGRPPRWLSPERGYTSVRSERAALRMSCGFTIDGELFAPEPEEAIELRADRRITFVRA